MNPSFEGCNGGETPAAVAAAADHAICFSGGALTITPADDDRLKMTGGQGALLQLNHEEELPINNDYSVSDYASAATPVSSELLRQASLLLDDELSSDTLS